MDPKRAEDLVYWFMCIPTFEFCLGKIKVIKKERQDCGTLVEMSMIHLMMVQFFSRILLEYLWISIRIASKKLNKASCASVFFLMLDKLEYLLLYSFVEEKQNGSKKEKRFGLCAFQCTIFV